jgi:hypothetical protein
MRRLPHQGLRHGTIDHGDAPDGVFFLIHSRVIPSSWVILLRRSRSSLYSLWMASRCKWLSVLQMAAPPQTYGWRSFGYKERGAEPTLEVGQAGRLGPTGPGPSQPVSIAPSLPWVLMCLCTLPLHLHYFDEVILASKMEVLFAWSTVFYASLPRDVPS